MTPLIVRKIGKIVNLLLSGIISGRFLDAFWTDYRYDGKQMDQRAHWNENLLL